MISILIWEAFSPCPLEGQLISTAPIINFPQSAGAFRFYKYNINTNCLRSSYLFSVFPCTLFSAPTRQYFTHVRQSATRESNSDAWTEMGSHSLSKGIIRMGEQHPVISPPPGLEGRMDAESRDRRGKGTDEGPQHPSLCFCNWGSVSYTLSLFEALKDHVYFLTMEQGNTLGIVYSVFSVLSDQKLSILFKNP